MSDKFTIRDFLVYFITGIFLLLSLLFEFKNSLFNFFMIEIDKAKEFSTLYIFLLIPGLYLAGHIVQGVDYFIFKLSFFLSDKCLGEGPKGPIVAIFLRHRIKYQLKKRNIEEERFWEACSYLIIVGKYDKVDYWNLMHTLFEGLLVIAWGWFLYYFLYIFFDFANFSPWKLVVSSLLVVILSFRTKQMADNFITTLRDHINGCQRLRDHS